MPTLLDDISIARALHVLAVVHWIGGVAMVTLVILPSLVRSIPAHDRLRLLRAHRGALWAAGADIYPNRWADGPLYDRAPWSVGSLCRPLVLVDAPDARRVGDLHRDAFHRGTALFAPLVSRSGHARSRGDVPACFTNARAPAECEPSCRLWSGSWGSWRAAVVDTGQSKAVNTVQWLVPSENVILLKTLYLPEGFRIGMRRISSSVLASYTITAPSSSQTETSA